MLQPKTILQSVGIFLGVYLFLLLPFSGIGKVYADFYRKQAFYFFNNFGSQGFVVFEEREDSENDDTRVYQANKNLANKKGDVESVPFNMSIRVLAYLPNILLISLFAATPVKLKKRLLLMGIGFVLLDIFLLCFLYILILNKYIQTPWLKMYQDLGSGMKSCIDTLNSSINHGMGLNGFLVVFIWLSLVYYFERDVLEKFVTKQKTS
ncbi:MAG: hypothetical protein IPI46_09625 [Bacteroidetes bacterium]|nr:hypothetical protein [Bacteroidota bacterium]